VVYPLNICCDFSLLVSNENQTTLPGTAACQISLIPAINNRMLTPKNKPLCSFDRTRKFSPGLASQLYPCQLQQLIITYIWYI